MVNRTGIWFLLLIHKHNSPQIYIIICDLLCVLTLTKFHCCSCFSDLPTASTTVLVSTTGASHTAGTTTIATVLGSANTTTEVIPKAVSEATITTPSFHLPSTTSILIDSEMTTGNSNLSQHCKRMRFLFSFSIYTISQKLMRWCETRLNIWVINRSDAGTSCCIVGDVRYSFRRHLWMIADVILVTWAVKEFVSGFHPTHMKRALEMMPWKFILVLALCLILVHPSFSAVCSAACRNMDDSTGASPILTV